MESQGKPTCDVSNHIVTLALLFSMKWQSPGNGLSVVPWPSCNSILDAPLAWK